MSIRRWAARVDTTQAAIVKGLRDMGVKVWLIREPCDLLAYFWCNRHHDFCWQTIECKTPYGKKHPKYKPDGRQEVQRRFLEDTRTPIALTLEGAIAELNKRHSLIPDLRFPCVLKSIPA